MLCPGTIKRVLSIRMMWHELAFGDDDAALPCWDISLRQGIGDILAEGVKGVNSGREQMIISRGVGPTDRPAGAGPPGPYVCLPIFGRIICMYNPVENLRYNENLILPKKDLALRSQCVWICLKI